MESSAATRFFLVCLGGALGTGARYSITLWALARFGPDFPYGTLIVNVVGSLLLGVVMELALPNDLLSPTLRLTLATGVLGGFTTYSAFNHETLRYLVAGLWTRALVYVVATLVICLVAGASGFALARRLGGV